MELAKIGEVKGTQIAVKPRLGYGRFGTILAQLL